MKSYRIIIPLFILLFNLPISNSLPISNKTIYVDDENVNGPWDGSIEHPYRYIQQAIDNATSGDTIFVYSGIYYENIIVYKSVDLIGEDRNRVIIDGMRVTKDAVVNITAPDVTLRGFTIENGWCEDEKFWDASGIKIFSSNVKIKGNVISFNRLGVTVATGVTSLTISDNIFIDDGILLGCYVYNKRMTKEDFLHEISNNTVNGKPLYYYKNLYNSIIPKDAGQIILVNCRNVTIRGVNITHTDFSITIAFCSNCTIEKSTITRTDGELILFNSNNNTIQNNVISYTLHGICLDFNSRYNVVRYNDISNSWVGISALTSSNNNLIYRNKLHDNAAGVLLAPLIHYMKPYDNDISRNSIYSNNVGVQIQDGSFNNTIQRNNISKNKEGILLKHSDNNLIRYNYFNRNFPISAIFMNCTTNFWDHNYWNRARILPKIIFGYKTIDGIISPWINIDRYPLKYPPAIYRGNILYVGGRGEGNYSSIQSAISDASSGDTIFVYSGIYHENVTIDKELSLIGENADTTIIDGIGNDTVTILAENIKLSGFTITNATDEEDISTTGIRIVGSNNIISDNIIMDNTIGVFIRRATNITICNNRFYNNGIIISPYDWDENRHIPLYDEYFIHTIEDNTVNGRKIYYLRNQRNISLPSDVGELIAFNCSNITVESLSFTRCDCSLLLIYTDNCEIRNSSFIDDADIWLIDCDNNIFMHNVMSRNLHGVTLDYNSEGNEFLYNNFSYNNWMGVMIEDESNYNIFEKNNFFGNNKWSAFIGYSFMNKWYSNYWDEWIGLRQAYLSFLPKIIFGSPLKNCYRITLPMNFDLHPADKPWLN